MAPARLRSNRYHRLRLWRILCAAPSLSPSHSSSPTSSGTPPLPTAAMARPAVAASVACQRCFRASQPALLSAAAHCHRRVACLRRVCAPPRSPLPVKTDKSCSQPDLQLRFVSGLGTSPDGVASYRDIGRNGRTPSGMTIQSLAIRPRARGAVTLRSSDPLDPPRLDTGFGTSDADLATLREGLRIAQRIVEQPAFDDVRGAGAWPRLDLEDAAAVNEYIASTVHSGNALAGSCKMGSAADEMAVVDERLCVMGTKGLRVVDASIIPTMPGGQLGATVLAIAERAADMINVAAADRARRG